MATNSNINSWDLAAGGGGIITSNDVNGVGTIQMSDGINGIASTYTSYPVTYSSMASVGYGPWKQAPVDSHEEPPKSDLKDYLRRKVLKR